ncbi:MAG: 4-(cytidine 5'-diphospho)-2-C-methyl-D-erythritol kinase, partial [Clostridia bacterium]|nr:4-(cytidine 5'-diphospho)-2-C-methyl-D-erythritol kinase [Clostridia bacterium]
MFCTQKAFAKINLSLDIVGRRPDGYHELVSVMQTLSLCDTLHFEKKCGDGISFSSNCDLPFDESNLIFRAAEAYFSAANTRFGLHVELDKRIPMKAGLGGGS